MTVKTYVNLLPLNIQRWQLYRLRLRQWSSIGAVAFLALGVSGWRDWSRSSTNHMKLEALEREYAPIQRLEKEIAGLQRQMAELQEREGMVLELADQRPILTLLGQVSRAAKHGGGGVLLQQFSLNSQETAAVSNGAKQAPAAQARKLLLTGLGVDNLSVAQFAAELRESGLFTDVRLTATGSTTLGGREAKTYALECNF